MTTYAPRPGEVDSILRRAALLRYRRAGGAAVAAVLAVVAVAAVPASRPHGLEPVGPSATTMPSLVPGRPSGATPRAAGPATPSAADESPAARGTAGRPSPSPSTRAARCRSAGATDRGVSATTVRSFSTVVQSGLGATYYGPYRIAANAAKNDVNATGGVCGRGLQLKLADDGGDPERTAQFLRVAVERDEVFGLTWAGDESSLHAAVRDGYVQQTRTPLFVRGGDSWLHGTPWVYPLGVSDADLARVMVRDAYDRGARTFGVVFDDPEVGEAFDAEVHRLTGKHLPGYPDIACRAQYCYGATDPEAFYKADMQFVGLLLEPPLMADWVTAVANMGLSYTMQHGGTDALLAPHVRQGCDWLCEGAWAWSAYKATCAYGDDAAVRAYRAAMERESPVADPSDPGLLATYAVHRAYAEALRAAGPALTRTRLAEVLDRPVAAPLTVAGEVRLGRNRTVRAYRLLRYDRHVREGCTFGPLVRF